MKREKADTLQSVELAMQILETLAAEHRGLGVTALAEALGTSKSRIHRFLRTLVSLGYITQSSKTERYSIGSRLIALGKAASEAADLTSVAQEPMRRLRDQTGQAAILGRLDDDGIRILNTMPGTMPIEVGVRPGSLLEYPVSAQGKVALALMEPERREMILSRPISAATEYTITDPEALREHLEQVRKCGWATAPNETLLGLNALASPILEAGNVLAGTVAIVSLTQYIKNPPDPEQIQAVRAAAHAISEALGFDGQFPGDEAVPASAD